ncbi:MAG TPA: zinc ribbon domain-containing protein [Pirellulales bacterium]|jgi:putative FmdB family regulatory protein
MPTYDYVCDACGKEFEEFQSITADALRKCPKCGKKKLRRLIGTGAAIMFKGSGFYQTDYRSDSYKQRAEADKPAASDSKSENKTADKSESKSEGKTGTDSGSSASGKSDSKKPAAKKKP